MGNVNTIDKQHVHDLEEFTKWTLQNVEAAYAKFVKAKADKGFTGDLVMSRREFWETFTDYATVVNGEFLSLPVEMYNLFDKKGKGKVYALLQNLLNYRQADLYNILRLYHRLF